MLEQLLKAPSQATIRRELQSLVAHELLGPAGGPEEELDEAPQQRYLVGMLAPRHHQPPQQGEFDELGSGDQTSSEDGMAESTTPAARALFPTSLGLTFCVHGDVSAIRVTARWGRYKRLPSTIVKPDNGKPPLVWKRKPMEGTAEIPLQEGDIPAMDICADQTDVMVRGRIRSHDGHWLVTLFLVNEQDEPKKLRDQAWLFQPELIVEAKDGSAIFGVKPQSGGLRDAEDDALNLLYRDHVEFAVGHNVAIDAEPSPDDPTRAIRISTRTIPSYELPRTTPPTSLDLPGLSSLQLDMDELGRTTSPGIALQPLADAYREWIEDEKGRATDPALASYEVVASKALANCEEALRRLEAGLKVLETDENAAQAFRFMNQAMALQRTHSIYSERVRRGEKLTMSDVDIPANRTWYPFQLAFVIINLPGLSDLHHPDRSLESSAVADLLWFPTGGGKTEAYLGLTAFTLGLRRLQGTIAGRSSEEGVAVLMRYTLRLLTLQQFQRATALICACEVIRRGNEVKWGKKLFRLGLWVGQRTTPNTTGQSSESLKQSHGHFNKGSAFGGSGSPAQLTNCPWCGTTIEPGKHIQVEEEDKGRGRTLIYCPDYLTDCPFSSKNSKNEGLPVLVVDEEIYRQPPALLIATVDKFAQMPWKGEVQMLFGQVNAYCPRHGFRSSEPHPDSHPSKGSLPAVRSVHDLKPLRPPDLIIQDELHLISGPLGSLVGLYETVVDRLGTWEVDGQRVRPKVVASTATIRRAAEQVHALFQRDVRVFPPQGLDIRDNFFSRQREPDDDNFGRSYVGVCAPGRRLKEVLIRVYVAYLAAAQTVYKKYGKSADPWMTLVGYFNSLRELGGTRRLVEDDVRSRLQRMDKRGLEKRTVVPDSLEELTSRKSSTDIPRLLDWLEMPFDPSKDPGKGRRPLDVLLATNMLSVGVDVRRLGLMVVAGQPKNTAEYIQATSRIGRHFPGLVCTVFNWSRPRDLSHYERFEHYHSTFYKHVEPLSVTPFAPRALDRGLTALLVSCVRLMGLEFNANGKAGSVTPLHVYVQEALRTIGDRALSVTGDPLVQSLVLAELQQRVNEWNGTIQAITGGTQLGYQGKKDGVTIGLLQKPGLEPWGMFTCLNSLRDVEPTANLVLTEQAMDQAPPPGRELLFEEATGGEEE